MRETVIDRITTSPTARPVFRPVPTRRPARGSGRAASPMLRPVETCPAPAATRLRSTSAHACVMPMPGAEAVSGVAEATVASWRLTDRGVATVLVAGLMIMVAALTVVGLTALRVTSDSYQPSVTASLPR